MGKLLAPDNAIASSKPEKQHLDKEKSLVRGRVVTGATVACCSTFIEVIIEVIITRIYINLFACYDVPSVWKAMIARFL